MSLSTNSQPQVLALQCFFSDSPVEGSGEEPRHYLRLAVAGTNSFALLPFDLIHAGNRYDGVPGDVLDRFTYLVLRSFVVQTA